MSREGVRDSDDLRNGVKEGLVGHFPTAPKRGFEGKGITVGVVNSVTKQLVP